jgi:hypothetical protein
MGKIDEFISLDGVIDEPTWIFEYGFDPKMGEAIGGAMASCEGILLGRATYEMFEPAWSARTAAEDPGAPFMNDTMKYVVSSTLEQATWRNSEIAGPYCERQLTAPGPGSGTSALPPGSPSTGINTRTEFAHGQGPAAVPVMASWNFAL